MGMNERKEGTDWETKQILEILVEGNKPDLEMEAEPAWHLAGSWISEE